MVLRPHRRRETGKRSPTQQICNFRAQTDDDWTDWKWFVQWCKDSGITTCRPLIAFIRSFRRSMDGLIEGLEARGKREILNAFHLIVALEQQNTFVYSVEKPRRQQPDLLFFRNNFRTATITSRMRLSYILEKARFLHKHIQKTFCFRDFAEIKHYQFRKLVLQLKRSGHIVAVEPRTNPRFYTLIDSPRTKE